MSGRPIPVVIIGAGPTGLAAATLLAQYGVESLVLERWERVYPLPRAVHLDDEIYRILTRLGVADEQRWLVADVATETDLGQWEGAQQVCDPHRAATYMSVSPTHHRWEFRLLPGETADDYRQIERLHRLLAPWTGRIGVDQLQIIRVAEYTFRAQVADRWRDRQVFLLGDAAHLTPPFIGQGMGAGMRDAMNLAWKLAGVLRGDLPGSVLETYQAERKPHVRTMIRRAKLMGIAMTAGGEAGAACHPSRIQRPSDRTRLDTQMRR